MSTPAKGEPGYASRDYQVIKSQYIPSENVPEQVVIARESYEQMILEINRYRVLSRGVKELVIKWGNEGIR